MGTVELKKECFCISMLTPAEHLPLTMVLLTLLTLVKNPQNPLSALAVLAQDWWMQLSKQYLPESVSLMRGTNFDEKVSHLWLSTASMRRPTRGLILALNFHAVGEWQWQRVHHCLFCPLQSIASTATLERFCHFPLGRSLAKTAKCPRASGQVLSSRHITLRLRQRTINTQRTSLLITHWKDWRLYYS